MPNRELSYQYFKIIKQLDGQATRNISFSTFPHSGRHRKNSIASKKICTNKFERKIPPHRETPPTRVERREVEG